MHSPHPSNCYFQVRQPRTQRLHQPVTMWAQHLAQVVTERRWDKQGGPPTYPSREGLESLQTALAGQAKFNHWPLSLELLRGVYSAQWASVKGLHTGLLEGSKPHNTPAVPTQGQAPGLQPLTYCGSGKLSSSASDPGSTLDSSFPG